MLEALLPSLLEFQQSFLEALLALVVASRQATAAGMAVALASSVVKRPSLVAALVEIWSLAVAVV
jgi:predicted membrane-bound dolichyl-phosphate-mannose-protein mannosyltransferase